MFLGRPPKKPPGRVGLALTLLGFPVWSSVMLLTWGAIPPLLTLALLGMGLGGVMATLASLAEYHRWRGGRPGELLRLASHLPPTISLVLFLAHFALNEEWGWIWWSAFVLGLTVVVGVAGYYYGPDEPPESEGGASAGHGPGD
jgi:hypothetical protein